MRLKHFAKLTLVAGGVLVGAGLFWRFAARRRSMPCPHWLSCLLENSYMETVAGSALLLERAGLAPGMKVLDVGCGPGRLTIPAAKHIGPEGKVVALDIQAEMLRRLTERAQQEGLTNIEPVHAGIGEAKLARDSFDRALLVTVLGEIPNRDTPLQEICESLRPGGWLSVTEVLPDPHYQRKSVVRRLAAEAGFVERGLFSTRLAYTINFEKPVEASAPGAADETARA
jgi:ubiquinone/menaquinone biosynthesis C-methylase UbiE